MSFFMVISRSSWVIAESGGCSTRSRLERRLAGEPRKGAARTDCLALRTSYGAHGLPAMTQTCPSTRRLDSDDDARRRAERRRRRATRAEEIPPTGFAPVLPP